MPDIPFGLSSYERGPGGLPELPVINLYAEDAPTEETGVMLQSRPGLEDRASDLGAGPVEALFQRDLVLGSSLFGVSAGNLYRDGVLVGPIDGAGPVSIAGYENFVFVAAGASLWGYDGTTLTSIAMPDDFDVAKVIVAASRVIVIRKDTGKFYWSDPLESDIEALDFATAENQPDRVLDMLFIDDVLRLFGAETVENWPNTPSGTLPFTPLEASVIEKGIRATGCAVAIASTFAWVTNENQVCLGDENNFISNPGLEERIGASTECRLFTFLIGGAEFLALRIDNETQVWGWRNKSWSRFTSEGQANWIPQCFAADVFGSSIDGLTIAWGTDYSDLEGTLERRLRGGFYGSGSINNLVLRCNVGQAQVLEGDYAEPIVEARVSRDHGRTFGPWLQKSLGVQGAYDTAVEWRALGMTARRFGWLAELRVTDPVDWRVSGVMVNEPIGGR